MVRIGDHWLADFASCNYLGFDLDPEIIASIPDATAKWGTHPSWSPDGRTLGCTAQDSKSGRDVVMVPLDGGKPREFLASPSYNEYNPMFSPDGRWQPA